eukprot:gnl/Carplike_NY0171/3640_a4915_442.p1 GENE.gnl/Carplike_NY0171/3640_a4915_442~~gnl/Carplike_NY0171/3640_a4915_442.p1  ORF type:complete len:578 (-),score=120.48 gnl/Carplike_NY0171/3640_a4915_442:532-2265(-)
MLSTSYSFIFLSLRSNFIQLLSLLIFFFILVVQTHGYPIPPPGAPCAKDEIEWDPFSGVNLVFTQDAVQILADGVDGQGGLVPELEDILMNTVIPNQQFSVDAGIGSVQVSLKNFDITNVSADKSDTFLISDFGFDVRFNKLYIRMTTDFSAKMITFPYSEFSGILVISTDIDISAKVQMAMNIDVRPVTITLYCNDLDISIYNLSISFSGDSSAVLNTILAALSTPLSSLMSSTLTSLLNGIINDLFGRVNGGMSERCTDDFTMQVIVMSNQISVTASYMTLPHFGYTTNADNIEAQATASHPPYDVLPHIVIPDIVMDSPIQLIVAAETLESIYYDTIVLRQQSDFDQKKHPDTPSDELNVPYSYRFTPDSMPADLPSYFLNSSVFSTFSLDSLSALCSDCDIAIRYTHRTDEWPKIAFSETSIETSFYADVQVYVCLDQLSDPSSSCAWSEYTEIFSSVLSHDALGVMLFDTYDMYTQFEITNTDVTSVTTEYASIDPLTVQDVSSLLHFFGVLLFADGLNDRNEDYGFQHSTRFIFTGYHGCIVDSIDVYYSADGYVALGGDPVFCYVFDNDN